MGQVLQVARVQRSQLVRVDFRVRILNQDIPLSDGVLRTDLVLWQGLEHCLSDLTLGDLQRLDWMTRFAQVAFGNRLHPAGEGLAVNLRNLALVADGVDLSPVQRVHLVGIELAGFII
eukprot:CAMPEP_0170488496 /NCGR_PEP_ID=MMETSP0208-20121228/7047_1 /TAXON_ID=197538 /ORGANISM="Strombidium inclinatum, Strain S3" /LENGTH=117 /DNA_ID=CAMNT_0010763097 /DNA_START=780 /DNA_END=1133 /DNA_ORIENTATION=+